MADLMQNQFGLKSKMQGLHLPSQSGTIGWSCRQG
jgi:hypothetical protein